MPPKPKDPKPPTRSEQVKIRLTVQERLELSARIGRSGLKDADYCRRQLLDQPAPSHRGKADPAMIVQLNQIGVALNDLALKFNAAAHTPPDLTYTLARVNSALDDMQGIRHDDDEPAELEPELIL